jgi:sugar phosphate isomerase/epimerase
LFDFLVIVYEQLIIFKPFNIYSNDIFMSHSRRKFIKQSSLALAGAALISNKTFSMAKASKTMLGIQLYSVRDDMKKDPTGTLKQLAAMGYKDVEHAGYRNRKFYGYSPEDFKKFLHDIGLNMVSGHSNLGAKAWDKTANDFTDVWKNTFEDAAAVGMKYVFSPGVDESLCKNEDDYKWYMDLFNKTGELAKKTGVQFGYHSESFEFDHYLNNKRLYDILLDTTDKNLVAQQIDIGNMYGPGARAMDYLKKYQGRFIAMHVKDEIKSNQANRDYESTVLGKGVIEVKNIIDYAKAHGTELFIIEQESYQDKTPIECAKEDLATMKQWGF